MAVDGYPEIAAMPNLAFPGAIGDEDNQFLIRFPEEVKESMPANPCRHVYITGPTPSRALKPIGFGGVAVSLTFAQERAKRLVHCNVAS